MWHQDAEFAVFDGSLEGVIGCHSMCGMDCGSQKAEMVLASLARKKLQFFRCWLCENQFLLQQRHSPRKIMGKAVSLPLHQIVSDCSLGVGRIFI